MSPLIEVKKHSAIPPIPRHMRHIKRRYRFLPLFGAMEWVEVDRHGRPLISDARAWVLR